MLMQELSSRVRVGVVPMSFLLLRKATHPLIIRMISLVRRADTTVVRS
jgi:hypothetical protein